MFGFMQRFRRDSQAGWRGAGPMARVRRRNRQPCQWASRRAQHHALPLRYATPIDARAMHAREQSLDRSAVAAIPANHDPMDHHVTRSLRRLGRTRAMPLPSGDTRAEWSWGYCSPRAHTYPEINYRLMTLLHGQARFRPRCLSGTRSTGLAI
jgi:hypothetical protein